MDPLLYAGLDAVHEGVAAAAARGLARAPALPAGGAAGHGAAGGLPDPPGPPPRKTGKDWLFQESDSNPNATQVQIQVRKPD